MTDNKETELVKQLRARAASEDAGGNEAAAERAMMGMEAQSDLWAERVNLNDLIENIVNVGRLKDGTPEDVRESFIKRQRERIDALMRQSYLEGYLEGGLARKAYDANLDCQTADMIEALSRRPAATSEAAAGDWNLDAIIEESVIGGTDDFPAINRASLIADLRNWLNDLPTAPASPDRQTRDGVLEEAAKVVHGFVDQAMAEVADRAKRGKASAHQWRFVAQAVSEVEAAIRALKSTLPAVEKEQDGPSPLGEALRKVGHRPATPKRGFA